MRHAGYPVERFSHALADTSISQLHLSQEEIQGLITLPTSSWASNSNCAVIAYLLLMSDCLVPRDHGNRGINLYYRCWRLRMNKSQERFVILCIRIPRTLDTWHCFYHQWFGSFCAAWKARILLNEKSIAVLVSGGSTISLGGYGDFRTVVFRSGHRSNIWV